MEDSPEQNRRWDSNSHATLCPIPTLFIILLVYKKFIQMFSKWIADPLALISSESLAGQQGRCAVGFHIGLLSQLLLYLSSCSSPVVSSGGQVTASHWNLLAGMKLQSHTISIPGAVQVPLQPLNTLPGSWGTRVFFHIVKKARLSSSMHTSGCHPLTRSVKCPTPSIQLFRAVQGFVDEKLSMTRKSHVANFYLLCTSLKKPGYFTPTNSLLPHWLSSCP